MKRSRVQNDVSCSDLSGRRDHQVITSEELAYLAGHPDQFD